MPRRSGYHIHFAPGKILPTIFSGVCSFELLPPSLTKFLRRASASCANEIFHRVNCPCDLSPSGSKVEQKRKERKTKRAAVLLPVKQTGSNARRVLRQTAEHFLRLFNETLDARSLGRFAPIFSPKADRKSFVGSVIRNKSSSYENRLMRGTKVWKRQ